MTANKHTPADVLERMRVATVFRTDLAEAREIVAELISASRDYADVEENAYDRTQVIAARKRLRDAIAKATGASA